MKFTISLVSLFIGAITSAADTAPSSSLRGSTGSSSNQRHHRDLGFSVTVGPTINPGCSQDAPKQGDSCSIYQQQCLYPITGSNDGLIIIDPSYWACNCDSQQGIYNCDVRCMGISCISTGVPTAAPVISPVGGRTGPVTAPPNYSWCPDTHPGHDSQCQYPGMECGYVESTSVVNCECQNLLTQKGPPQVWSRLWKCNGEDPTKRDRAGNSATASTVNSGSGSTSSNIADITRDIP